jgi:hypothetical protein
MGRSYTQQVEIIWPDGNAFVRAALPVPMEKPDWVTGIMNITSFPAGQPGKVVIRVWMEAEGERIGDAVDTFVRVNHGVLANVVNQGP